MARCSPHEPTDLANARPMTGSAICGGPSITPNRLLIAPNSRADFSKWRPAPGDLPKCVLHRKPVCAIRLGELGKAPRLRRPLHRETVALERCQVELAFERPRADLLAARLLEDLSSTNEPAGRCPVSSSIPASRQPGDPRRLRTGLSGSTTRHRPSSPRTDRRGAQAELPGCFPVAKHEQAGTSFGHG